jgi:hypothetical protein
MAAGSAAGPVGATDEDHVAPERHRDAVEAGGEIPAPHMPAAGIAHLE